MPVAAELAAINGVGPATANSILLAMGHSVYPLDRGTYRILSATAGPIRPPNPTSASELLSRLADDNRQEIDRISTWLVQVGRQFCGPRTPKCDRCPLRCVLPENGPLEPES